MGKTSGKKIFILVLFFLLITTSFLYAANIRLIMNFDNVQKTLIVSTDITYDQLFSRFVLLFEKYKVTPSMIDMYIKGKRIDSTGALAAALYDYRSEDYATVQVDIRYSARGRQMLGESAAGEQNGEQQPGVDPSRVKVMAELEAKKALQEAAGKGGVIKRKLDRILDNLGRDEMQIRLDGDRQKADQDFDTYLGERNYTAHSGEETHGGFPLLGPPDQGMDNGLRFFPVSANVRRPVGDISR